MGLYRVVACTEQWMYAIQLLLPGYSQGEPVLPMAPYGYPLPGVLTDFRTEGYRNYSMAV